VGFITPRSVVRSHPSPPTNSGPYAKAKAFFIAWWALQNTNHS